MQNISDGLLDPIVPRGRADILHEYQARLPEAMAWMAGYFADLVAAKGAAPADDLLSELIAVPRRGR